MGAARKLPPDGREKRTFRGMFVAPRAQFMLCALLSGGFVLLGLFIIFAMVGFNHSVEQLRRTFQLDTDTANLITGHIFLYLRIALSLAVFFAVSGIAAGIALSHRIYGPMVPILAHVKRLVSGNYKSRANLRENDEFSELVSELNALAEKLERKS
jgi:nitrogen fixation/metabolism regulation signal transduction histidine kinase